MMKAGPDYYEELSSSDRLLVDRWRNRRAGLLRDRMMGEMKAKMEEYGHDVPPSTRFLRLVVRSFGDPPDSESNQRAMLTIWKPSDDQLEEINEGSFVRVKHLDVKGSRFDGMKQFSANENTPMKIVANGALGSKPEEAPNFFRLFTVAKRVSVDLSTNRSSFTTNAVGVVLKVENLGRPDWRVFLVDESCKVLCVKGELACKDLELRLSSLGYPSIENTRPTRLIVGFRGLRLASTDVKQSLILAKFTEGSSFDPHFPGSRSTALKIWSDSAEGQYRLLELAACFDIRVQRLFVPRLRVVGYIASFELCQGQLVVYVDCGQCTLRPMKLPLSIVQSFAPSCEDLSGSVFLDADDESQTNGMGSLGRMLHSRRIIYCFSLKPIVDSIDEYPEIEYEVAQVSGVDTDALSSLYSVLNPYDCPER